MGHRNQLAIYCGENTSELFSYFNLLFQNYIKSESGQDKQLKQLHYCSKKQVPTLTETRLPNAKFNFQRK